MKPKGLLPCLQEPVTVPYPKPDESISHPPDPFSLSGLNILLSTLFSYTPWTEWYQAFSEFNSILTLSWMAFWLSTFVETWAHNNYKLQPRGLMQSSYATSGEKLISLCVNLRTELRYETENLLTSVAARHIDDSLML
jgi:hypothetical protein